MAGWGELMDGGRLLDDRGVGSAFAAFALLVLLLLAAAGIELGGAVAARHRAQSAADLAALAAVGQVVVGGDGCAAARVLADRNSGRLTVCTLHGDDVLVEVAVALPLGIHLGSVGLGPAVAVARAGPIVG